MKLELPKLALPQVDALKDALARILASPAQRRMVLAGAASVLVLGIWYFGFIQPTATRVGSLKARHEAAQRQLATVGSTAGVAEVRARVTALEGRVRTALGRMSQDVQFVQVLKQLSADAARFQITVERIDVKAGEAGTTAEGAPPRPREGSSGGTKPEEKGKAEEKAKPLDIRTQKLELTLYCSYDAAARFLDNLKTLPAFVIIDTLEIERETETFPNLKVLLTLKFHSIKKLPEELTKT
jgi:type II secretory pathway component PulM